MLISRPVTHLSLHSFKVQHFHSIKQTEVNDLPQYAPWVMITGENGAGKTNLLQALAVGLTAPPARIHALGLSGAFKVRVETFQDSNIESFFVDLDMAFRAPRISNVLGYGSSRLHTYSESSEKEREGARGLFDANTLLQNIEYQFSRWYFKQDQPRFKHMFERVQEVLLRLLPQIEAILIDNKTDEMRYVETDADRHIIEAVPLHHLPSGHRSLIAMVGDMLLRLFESQPETTDPAQLHGMVLIDEIELHLHPHMQTVLPGLLTGTFPNIQFVTTTHSPLPLIGAPEGSVLLRARRSHKTGMTVNRDEALEKRVNQMTPAEILHSPLFDLGDLLPSKSTASAEEDSGKSATQNRRPRKGLFRGF